MRAYIAGPMTGYPHFNIPAFDEAAERLRAIDIDVVSPAELDDPEDRDAAFASPDGSPVHYESGKTWGDFLARDVKLLSDGGFDSIFLLPGWEKSKGARLETFVGVALHGMRAYEIVGYSDGVDVVPVHPLRLFRAWCGDDTIALHPAFGGVAP